MSRFLIPFFGTFIGFIAVAWIWVLKEPMAFLNPDYPSWRYKMESASNLPPNSVVFLGDSRVESDIIPEKIAPDLYNLGLNGAASIESYALARTVAASSQPPRAVLISIGPLHFMVDEFMWTYGVADGLIDFPTLDEIRVQTRRTNDLSLWKSTDLKFEHRRPLFDGPTCGDIDARLKEELYTSHFPSYYFGALLNARIFMRKSENAQIYQSILKAQGYRPRGLENGTHMVEAVTALTSFTPSPILDLYFSKTIEIFQKRNIPVYFIGTPSSDLSIAALSPGFRNDYIAYIKAFETRYPNFHVLGDPYPVLPAANFGDSAHLNPDGAGLFSDQIADRLRQAGIEK